MKIKLTMREINSSMTALNTLSQKPLEADISRQIGRVIIEIKPIFQNMTEKLLKRANELDIKNDQAGFAKYREEEKKLSKQTEEIEFEYISYEDLTADKTVKFEPVIFSELEWLIKDNAEIIEAAVKKPS